MKRMKALLLSTSDIEGGAARAAYRLHQGLSTTGVDSYMFVQKKVSDDRTVLSCQNLLGKLSEKLKLSEHLDRLPLKRYHGSLKSSFSLQWTSEEVPAAISTLNPQIINVHWICKGFLRIETLATFKQPIVLTLHDMWAFTGGCHYSQECDRYTQSCGACPQLKSRHQHDLSRWVWSRKAKAWKDLNLTVVTPSRWLAECASRSSLFQQTRVEVIPNGLDTQIYKPMDRCIARDRLNLPQDKFLVLFGAMYATSDARKGFHLLQPALQKLSTAGWQDKLELIVFGAAKPSQPTDFGFKTHYLGSFQDDLSLALIYAAADVFVAPSVQDNLPNTVMEALACGTPSVAFKIGGMPDLIEHQYTGYLAQPYEADDLAAGIAWILDNPERHAALCQQSRQTTEQEFTVQQQAQAYKTLFEELLAS
jgi:glycosyltransferase involved in cell wall biosynthesis